ncbi:hypothetical protein BU15DRAFT_80126 [Melanogaster broomeanus]|nr:hypothetical protein BU15DRAFT_80126 [Melanogaster broomeanus]
MSSSSPPAPTLHRCPTSSKLLKRPSPPSTITSASYFFGFIITFVVLLLLFVGCGVGSRRRFTFLGMTWGAGGRQDVDEGAFGGRGRGGRRKFVRPVFWEAWMYPKGDPDGQEGRWEGIQPVSASFIRPPLNPSYGAQFKSDHSSLRPSSSQISVTDSQPHGRLHRLRTALNPYGFHRHHPCTDQPPKPPPPERPPPEAVQIAVMIRMPSPSSWAWDTGNSERPSTSRSVGEQTSELGEYQIGITQLPWTSGDTPQHLSVPGL